MVEDVPPRYHQPYINYMHGIIGSYAFNVGVLASQPAIRAGVMADAGWGDLHVCVLIISVWWWQAISSG